MKKPGTGSTGKGGLGSIGKSGLGLTGKSGLSSSGKSGGVLGSSGKSGLSSTSKSELGYTSKSASSTSKSGSNLLSKTASPKPSKSFDFLPSGKPTSLAPSSPKNYPSSSSYENAKTVKSSATFGIIWIPTKKRNKKKDIVLNPNNDTHRMRERSPSFYKFMSGDSHDQPPPHKKEEVDLLVVPDRKIGSGPLVAATALATAAEGAPSENTAATSPDDKQQLIGQDTEDSKDAAGDSKDETNSDDDQDYLHNDGPVRKNLPDTLSEKDTFGDKLDSVYLRPPPPHKARSNASRTEEEESCGMKCLYYTLQCCDCVLM